MFWLLFSIYFGIGIALFVIYICLVSLYSYCYVNKNYGSFGLDLYKDLLNRRLKELKTRPNLKWFVVVLRVIIWPWTFVFVNRILIPQNRKILYEDLPKTMFWTLVGCRLQENAS